MTISMSMVWLILGCMIVTLIPRIIPFIFVKNVRLPDAVLKWLSYIPVCILTALVVENLILKTGDSLRIDWTVLVAMFPTLAVALWTKSLSLTVIVGVAVMAGIRLLY